jgi:hypothetical protein
LRFFRAPVVVKSVVAADLRQRYAENILTNTNLSAPAYTYSVFEERSAKTGRQIGLKIVVAPALKCP